MTTNTIKLKKIEVRKTPRDLTLSLVNSYDEKNNSNNREIRKMPFPRLGFPMWGTTLHPIKAKTKFIECFIHHFHGVVL